MTDTPRFSPGLHDLVRTVRDFLNDLAPRLERGPAYEAQVARYLLDMVLRELESGDRLDADTRRRFEALLGDAVDDPIARLSERLRSGALDARWDDALRAILEDTVQRVDIVRPDVLAAEHAGNRRR